MYFTLCIFTVNLHIHYHMISRPIRLTTFFKAAIIGTLFYKVMVFKTTRNILFLHTDDRHRKSVPMKASDVKPKRR